ncbi:unnamed protein product [Spirodela intermedia]|uniref:Uncharacterized protein n=1 Tax=Spirodela intermedia TaxID=51605 RepID=A0A7I8KAU6_SPIIN|nr:unnamed protein product [Spirodela intermedia]CAA7394344.1 unnamed protein product [Spirodela intermedia]
MHRNPEHLRGSSCSEVATHLPADRPLLDDGLFIDQSKMIYSMDLQSFYLSPIGPSRSSLCSWLLSN